MAVTLAWELRADDFPSSTATRLKAARCRLLNLAADLDRIGWPRAGLSMLATVAQIDAELLRRGLVVMPHGVLIPKLESIGRQTVNVKEMQGSSRKTLDEYLVISSRDSIASHEMHASRKTIANQAATAAKLYEKAMS